MDEIKKHHLIEAMKAGCRIDGPAFFGAKRTRWPFGTAPWLMPFQPPFQQASFELGVATATGDEVSIGEFETAADDAKAVADNGPGRGERWPFVHRNTLREALAEAALTIAHPVGTAKEIIRMRSGLQLYRVEIRGDNNDDCAPLTLTNGDLPFSLRFIACVFRMPLALSNLNLVTLDLSGSALVGVDATFLGARGSVRLRRCYSNAPIDFAGAQIYGYFDCCDILLQPFGKLPAGQAVNGDRGMLNLNQASIDNEVRLIRAMIWGGLSMRGLTTQRSVWLDKAILLSPLAVLEKIFKAQLDSYNNSIDPLNSGECKSPLQSNERMDDRDALIALADNDILSRCIFVVKGNIPGLDNCLDILMRENLRVRTSGLRGDGMMVAGSLFARDILCRGRLRLKYAKVNGALWLQGSNLSSAETMRATFDDNIGELNSELEMTRNYRNNTYNEFAKNKDGTHDPDDNLAFGADDYALDLRESNFGGSVSISSRANPINGAAAERTKADGVINIERANIDGKLIFDEMEFIWTCRWKNAGTNSKKNRAHYNNIRDYEVLKGRQYALLASGVVVGDDVSFCKTKFLNGANFANAQIGGSFCFFDRIERGDEQNLTVVGSAEALKGRIALEGARISGDCKLIFDKLEGPVIKAERVEVFGLLAISSVPTKNKICNSAVFYNDMLDKNRERRNEYKQKAMQGLADFDEFDFPPPAEDGPLLIIDYLKKNPPMIDLGNAKAGYFHHPPAAWPQVGRLMVMGFHYRRALRYGPLAPHPFPKGNMGRSPAEVCKTSLITVALLVPGSTGLGYCIYALSGGPWEAWALAGCFVIAGIYRLVGKGLFGCNPMPTNRPMAIAWLKLQTVERNAYRSTGLPGLLWKGWRRGHIYHSLEPYAVAAAALREEGRWVSANLVEEESLKVRERQLSWRLSLGQKLLDQSVAFVNNYGFSLERPAFWTAVLMLSGAILAHCAAASCAITSKAYASTSCQPYCPSGALQKVNCDTMSSGFRPSLYAIEKVLPGVDFNQEQYWELDKNATPYTRISWLTYEVIFSLLHMLGLGVFGLLAVAVTTRLGLTFKRYNG